MVRELVCIQCPQGCSLKVDVQGEGITVEGNKCPRGLSYAKKELSNPGRTLTTTVRTCFKDYPLLPVRTQGEIPLSRIFAVMKELDSVLVAKRLQPGDIVIPRLSGTDVALLATADMTAQEQAAACS